MKRLIVLMLLPFIMEGQNDSIWIIKHHDDMKDKTFQFFNKKMVFKEDVEKIGFAISPNLSEKYEITDLLVKMVGYKGCNEKDELVIMFEDSSKIKMISFAEFNCEGNVYFKVGKKETEVLKTKKILKAMLMNGRSYESHTIKASTPDYFIKAYDAIDKKIIKIKTS